MRNTNDKKFKIQIEVSGNTLTYNLCTILSEDDVWLEFTDKFGTKFKVNKANIIILEEINSGDKNGD